MGNPESATGINSHQYFFLASLFKQNCLFSPATLYRWQFHELGHENNVERTVLTISKNENKLPATAYPAHHLLRLKIPENRHSWASRVLESWQRVAKQSRLRREEKGADEKRAKFAELLTLVEHQIVMLAIERVSFHIPRDPKRVDLIKGLIPPLHQAKALESTEN